MRKSSSQFWAVATVSVLAMLAAGQGAYAAEAVVGGCSGVSLPRSVVTDILGPVVTGAVQPVETTTNGVLGALTPLLGGLLPGTVNTDIAGLLRGAATGDAITLSAIKTDGTLVGPTDNCVVTADAFKLDQDSGVAIGGNRISGLGATGATAQAGEVNSVAIGNGASTSAAAASSVALGRNANATTANSVALGAGSVADDPLTGAAYNPGGIALAGGTPVGEVSIGNAGAERRLTNVAAGSADTDGANIGQLRSLGTFTNSRIDTTNQALAELSSIAVVYDVDQQGRKTNGVTLKGGDTSKPVAVHNVARGEAPTDAVNVAQLDDGLADNRSYADNVAGDSYQRSRAYTDQQVGEVRDEARQAAAIGLAASSLRFDGTPGKVSVGASGGVWRGEAAFAVGVGYTDENGKVRANATATTAGGAVGAGGGFTVTLN